MTDPISPASPLAGVQDCLVQLGRTLAIARSLALGGKHVDLTGLDAEFGFVCARALDLPPEDGRSVRPCLVALRAELDALEDALVPRAPPSAA